MKLDFYLTFVTLVFILDFIEALYFHIKEGERKCFIRDIPDDTNVIVKYKTQLLDPHTGDVMTSLPNIGMNVIVQEPNNRLVLARVYSPEKNISFVSRTAGEHVLCMYTNSIARFSRSHIRVHLDIQAGSNAIDYAYMAQIYKLNEMQLRIRQLLNQLYYITNEQKYQKQREERFRELSESTTARVLWWCLIQTGILVAIGYWQKHIYNSAYINYNSVNTNTLFVVNSLQLKLIHDGTPNDLNSLK